MAATQPIRDKEHIRRLTRYYLDKNQLRNHVLIVLGLHIALRISDLLLLKWGDVYDFERNCVRSSITVIEKKTGKTTNIALNRRAVSALELYFAEDTVEPDGFLFVNKRTGKPISRIQAYRLIRAAGEAVAIEHRISCHSLRKTFGYHTWKSGVSPAVIMEIYNHSSLAVTRRYLGVTQDDKDKVFLELDLTA